MRPGKNTNVRRETKEYGGRSEVRLGTKMRRKRRMKREGGGEKRGGGGGGGGERG